MDSTQKLISSATQRCLQHGERLTHKREQILRCLLEADRPLSAYEIMDNLHNYHNTSIQAMSIYRILDFLLNRKLVHKLQLTSKYVACSHIACSHEHRLSQFLICARCSRVKEISIDKTLIENLQSAILRAGYCFTGSQLELNCLCNRCAEEHSGAAP